VVHEKGIFEWKKGTLPPVKRVAQGGTDFRVACDYINDGKAGKVDGLIGTIAVAGVGITLTRADTIIFIEEDWVPANNRQMEDRIYRVGQKNDVTVIKYRSKDTVDTLDIAPANRLKQLIESAVYGDEE
jgi:SNF2 family DNA or RNA helicase